MKKTTFFLILLLFISSISMVLLALYPGGLASEELRYNTSLAMATPAEIDSAKGCVFQTVFEGDGVDPEFRLPMPEKVKMAHERGLEWLVTAQHKSGGFGAGSHARQHVKNPHAVKADPATTAMVAMAILRDGSTLEQGLYANELNKATVFLLKSVEDSKEDAPNITTLTGTQIQSKLGAYIDVALTSQYLTNLLDVIEKGHSMHNRVFSAMEVCVKKIERNQDSNGSTKGAGWAGVLQSSFATNALEAAEVKGVAVDTVALRKARDYQMGNFDAASGSIATESAAGVMLYSVSSSNRASAKDARKARKALEKAKAEGVVAEEEEVSQESLTKAGFTVAEAMRAATSYEVYEDSKIRAQEKEVVSGFGNNGGEEFLSFLQTGESLIVNEDLEWHKWYTNTSDRLMKIQNKDGSWNGHHCITSPVFCTATSLLVLSVNNDIDALVAQGN